MVCEGEMWLLLERCWVMLIPPPPPPPPSSLRLV